MRAGWIFTPCIVGGDGTLRPYFPAGTNPSFTNTIEVYRLTGSAVPHVHYLAGPFAVPNMDLGDNHWHAVLRSGAFYQQYTFNAVAHTHTDIERPTWFMPFVVTSDPEAAAIIADPQCYLVAECPIDGEGVIGPEDATPWTTEERDTWEALFSAALGLNLPAEVDRPSRLVMFVVALNRRQYDEATPLRPTEV